MLQAFFAELNKLSDLAEFTVVPFDTHVAKENNFDGHIVLTDMCAPKPIASKCQRMWMTTAYYAKHPYFKTNERIIAIEA